MFFCHFLGICETYRVSTLQSHSLKYSTCGNSVQTSEMMVGTVFMQSIPESSYQLLSVPSIPRKNRTFFFEQPASWSGKSRCRFLKCHMYSCTLPASSPPRHNFEKGLFGLFYIFFYTVFPKTAVVESSSYKNEEKC